MAYEITATKFRPQTFSELVGQDFVASTLKNSIQNKEIANAYLLSGPRGIGKTSAARIIAKSLNCIKGPTGTPCNKCENCISITHGNNSDVIEIDGASNTSINDIRVIQEEILYPPVMSKYKVYIIDEVHMLSKSAFNALLKTIEEPPENVVFIFATTEVNKVLATIRSRCQQFNFRLIPSDLIYKSLIRVLNVNKVKFEEKAVLWIARQGQGSMRDAYTLLDQVVSFCDKDITMKKIQEKLGLVGEERMSTLVLGIIAQDREKIFVEYYSLMEVGISPEQIIEELILFFRNILLIKSGLTKSAFIGFNVELYSKNIIDAFTLEDLENILEFLFKTYESSRFSIDVQTEIEISLLKLLNYKSFIRPKQIISELSSLKNFFLNSNNPIKNDKIIDKELKNDEKSTKTEENPSKEIKIKADKSEILKIIKSKLFLSHFQLVTALNNISYVEEKENKMYIYFTHKMHYDIAKEHEDLLTQEALAIIGKSYNKNFQVIVSFKKSEKKLSVGELNKNKIKEVFQGEEI